jgi:hypothetical protein
LDVLEQRAHVLDNAQERTDVANLLVQAAESGHDEDVRIATDELLRAVEQEGWMDRVRIESAAAA